MARFLMVGDVHLSDRAPTTRRDSYTQDILFKLEEVSELADEHEVDGVVFCGDIFHSKVPRNTSHKLVSAVADIWSGQRSTFVLPGNHDYAGQHIGSLREHPLYVLGELDSVTLFGVPGQRSVEAAGVTLYGVREEEPLERFVPEQRLEEPLVVVAHSAIFPPGEAPEMWPAWEAQEIVAEWDSLGDRGWPAVVWYGHIHHPHGHYRVEAQTGQYMEFVNLGSISRGSLHETDFDRIPEVGLLEVTESVSVTPIPLRSARPASEVFRVAEVELEQRSEASAVEFAAALDEVSLDVFSVEGLVDRLRSGQAGEDVPQQVVDRAVELVLEAAEG